jgi:NitT/TauT family transport system substrate-binding protein
MRRSVLGVVAFVLIAAMGSAFAQAPITVKVGLEASGTFSWVAYAMKRYGLDKKYGIDLQSVKYATKQASRLALREGTVDIVVDDFIGVVQDRNAGIPVQAVYPYSKATGGVVVRADSPIKTIADLKGKTIAAANLGDKSLLILRALTTTKYGFDPMTDGKVLSAAPPLMTQLLASGKIDAAIPYWHFVARMVGSGDYRDIMNVTDMLSQLGLRTDLPILVVVAREGANPKGVTQFLAALKQTEKQMEADSMSGVWQGILDQKLYSLPDPSLFPAVRKRWEAGLPTTWNQQVIDGLVTLVDQLVKVAGPNVVGVSKLPADAFTTKYAPNG